MSRKEILKYILDRKIVAVLRTNEPEKIPAIIDAISEGGISVIEITLTIPRAIEMINMVSQKINMDVLIGAGSVLNTDAAEQAINAGAKYVVSPVLNKEIIETAHSKNVAVMPGCFTPTEIQTAYEYGAEIIKVFPADILGMKFFKGILAPMPHLKLMPTGGVNLDNAGEWIKAGACAVGVGSALFEEKAIREGDYTRLSDNARLIVNNVNSAIDNISEK